MNEEIDDNSIIIIGAGFAGLAAGYLCTVKRLQMQEYSRCIICQEVYAHHGNAKVTPSIAAFTGL